MKNRNSIISTMTALLTILLLATGSFCLAAQGGGAHPSKPGQGGGTTAPGKPSTAELAAKREMVRKQQAQRITHDQRKAGAAALQAERKRVYDAKQTVKNSQQPNNGKN